MPSGTMFAVVADKTNRKIISSKYCTRPRGRGHKVRVWEIAVQNTAASKYEPLQKLLKG